VAIGGVNRENISEILPYKPSMVAVVRDYESISELKKVLSC
jgi:thiamine monophosphate synthase